MYRALIFLAGAALCAPAWAAEIDDSGQRIPTHEDWDLQLAVGEGRAAFPSGLWVGGTAVRRLRVAPAGLVGINAVPAVDPRALDAAGGAFIAPFWARLQAGPCPDGQPPGERRWAATPNTVRFVWLDVPLDGCPAGQRASFTVELTADAGGQLRRIEYRYGALPEVTAVEPRAGLVSPTVVDGSLEFFPDDGADRVRGRAKLLLSHSSDGASGVWIIELDANGAVAGDADADGVRGGDNCPRDPNPRQFDMDGDGGGDACDGDIDGDEISQEEGDNCPFTWNGRQEDRDGDGIGDHCDDGDGDRIVDALDRCPRRPNPAQLDLDGDGRPNACDGDIDGDGPLWGVWNARPHPDRCPYIWQWGQADRDKDGLGDPCDVQPAAPCTGFGCLFQLDSDGDGVLNLVDVCPTVADRDQADADGDRIGDACDPDLDGDTIPDIYAREGLICDPAVCPR